MSGAVGAETRKSLSVRSRGLRCRVLLAVMGGGSGLGAAAGTHGPNPARGGCVTQVRTAHAGALRLAD